MVLEDRAGKIEEARLTRFVKEAVKNGMARNKYVIDKCCKNNILMTGEAEFIEGLAERWDMDIEKLDDYMRPLMITEQEGDAVFFIKRNEKLEEFVRRLRLADRCDYEYNNIAAIYLEKDRIRGGHVIKYEIVYERSNKKIEDALYRLLLFREDELGSAIRRILLTYEKQVQDDKIRMKMFAAMMFDEKAKK